MIFDRTNGKEAKYMVTLYGWNVNDGYYFHYMKDAKETFEKLKSEYLAEGLVVSIYDLKEDKRKAFAKGEKK